MDTDTIVEDVELDPEDVLNAEDVTDETTTEDEATGKFAAAYAVTKTASRKVRRSIANGTKTAASKTAVAGRATSNFCKAALPIMAVGFGYLVYVWLLAAALAYLAIAAAAYPLIGILGTIALALYIGKNLGAIAARLALVATYAQGTA